MEKLETKFQTRLVRFARWEGTARKRVDRRATEEHLTETAVCVLRSQQESILDRRNIPEKAEQPEQLEKKAGDLGAPLNEGKLRRKTRKRWTLVPPKGVAPRATPKQSRRPSNDQFELVAQREGLPRDLEGLYVAMWDRMIRSIGRALVNHQTENWPGYFNGLRDLARKVLAEATAGLSPNEKADLARRLVERIDEMEKRW